MSSILPSDISPQGSPISGAFQDPSDSATSLLYLSQKADGEQSHHSPHEGKPTGQVDPKTQSAVMDYVASQLPSKKAHQGFIECQRPPKVETHMPSPDDIKDRLLGMGKDASIGVDTTVFGARFKLGADANGNVMPVVDSIGPQVKVPEVGSVGLKYKPGTDEFCTVGNFSLGFMTTKEIGEGCVNLKTGEMALHHETAIGTPDVPVGATPAGPVTFDMRAPVLKGTIPVTPGPTAPAQEPAKAVPSLVSMHEKTLQTTTPPLVAMHIQSHATAIPTPVAMHARSKQTATRAVGASHQHSEGNMGTYNVKKGDSLSRIAEKIYGDPSQWKRIYKANKEMLDKQFSEYHMKHPDGKFTTPQDYIIEGEELNFPMSVNP